MRGSFSADPGGHRAGAGRASFTERVGARGPEPETILVGNDVVDLRDPRCAGKARDFRFLKRICGAEEMSRILSSEDADATLWLHWAAKEAAFKVVSKAMGAPPVFRHAAFVVRLEAWSEGPSPVGFPRKGTVEFEGQLVPFHASVSSERVHVVAHTPATSVLPWNDIRISTGEAGVGHVRSTAMPRVPPFRMMLEERFTPREGASIHSPASAYVRLLARTALADALEVDETRLEVVCGREPTGRIPPIVLLDGARAPVDLTLSHHGHLVGWAFALTIASPET
jgi:phosphopantetheinyl transferase (holo-ACP synthase)